EPGAAVSGARGWVGRELKNGPEQPAAKDAKDSRRAQIFRVFRVILASFAAGYLFSAPRIKNQASRRRVRVERSIRAVQPRLGGGELAAAMDDFALGADARGLAVDRAYQVYA